MFSSVQLTAMFVITILFLYVVIDRICKCIETKASANAMSKFCDSIKSEDLEKLMQKGK